MLFWASHKLIAFTTNKKVNNRNPILNVMLVNSRTKMYINNLKVLFKYNLDNFKHQKMEVELMDIPVPDETSQDEEMEPTMQPEPETSENATTVEPEKKCGLEGIFCIKRGLHSLVSEEVKSQLRDLCKRYTRLWIETMLLSHLHLHHLLEEDQRIPCLDYKFFRLVIQCLLQHVTAPKKIPDEMQRPIRIYMEYRGYTQSPSMILHDSKQVNTNLISSMATTMATNAQEHLSGFKKRIIDYIQYKLLDIFRMYNIVMFDMSDLHLNSQSTTS